MERRGREIEGQLALLERISRHDGLSALSRLELGVLQGLLQTEKFDLLDFQLPRRLPAYFLFRLSIVNYLLRKYAPLDRRLRAIAKLQGQLPRFLRDLRATSDRRLSETYYELGEMAANGILEAYAKELPPHLAEAPAAVRRLVEHTNEVAIASLRSLVQDFEKKYKPRVKDEFALGRRRFERMVFSDHLAAIPIDRLLSVGLEDLDRNKDQFLQTASKVDPGKTPQAVLDANSRDHPKAETLISETSAMLEDIRRFLIDHEIVTVPSEERARVMETPRFYRFATAAMNSPGSFESVAKEAYYYVTPVEESWPVEKQEEWLRHLNYPTLRNISVHECYPGHYVHFLHRRRIRSKVLRSYNAYPFVEGWAHYCEEMMVEQGYGDVRLRLAQLQDALLRDCRYISSIRMHTDGWTWEDATRFFMENAFLERLPAEREAKRGTWDPGYLNYTLGKLMIKKLRADYMERHPETTLQEFHDALLGLGAPPLGLAREYLLGPDSGPVL